MKLLKAIEELERKCGFPCLLPSSDEFRARKLGIEGLRRLLDGRDAGDPRALVPLPGETED